MSIRARFSREAGSASPARSLLLPVANTPSPVGSLVCIASRTEREKGQMLGGQKRPQTLKAQELRKPQNI